MFDIFGLRKEIDPGAETPAGSAAPASGERSGAQKRLWAVLLVLDTVLIFVFGGALVGMLYIRMTSPPLAEVKGVPRTVVKRVPAPAGASGQDPAAKTEAPRPEAPKEAPKPEPPKAEPPKPEPVKTEAPKPAPKPAPSKPEPKSAPSRPEPAKTPPAAAPAGDKVRARAVEFSHRAADAKEVALHGPFLVRTGGKKAMNKDADGIWKTTISLLPGTYKFHFTVDGKRTPPESVLVEP